MTQIGMVSPTTWMSVHFSDKASVRGDGFARGEGFDEDTINREEPLDSPDDSVQLEAG